MTRVDSLRAYKHCEDIWDSALLNGSITVELNGSAMTKQQQHSLIADLVHFRKRLREKSKEIYPPTHPEYGTSVFDPFLVTRGDIDGKLFVRIRRRGVVDFKINVEDIKIK